MPPVLDDIQKELVSAITKAQEALRRDLGKLRAGRASPNLLDGIRVDYYGTMTPLSQMANINIPEPRLITVKPWDKTQVKPVEKALRESDLPKRHAVPLRRDRLRRMLDLDIADAEVERILSALGMKVERTADGWRATPPSWRFDIEIEEDLIEEVIRVHGYERVPTRAPRGSLVVPPMPEAKLGAAAFRAQLAARDYVEAVCFAFLDASTLKQWKLDEGAVPLANPLSAELGVMRTSLLPGLVAALIANRRRQQERVRLFELGNVFAAGRDAPSGSVKFANSRPASGSATPICSWPALLVAAIFQPETGWAATATMASWTA